MKNIKVSIPNKEVIINDQICSFYEAGLYYTIEDNKIEYMGDWEDISEFFIDMYSEKAVRVHVDFTP